MYIYVLYMYVIRIIYVSHLVQSDRHKSLSAYSPLSRRVALPLGSPLLSLLGVSPVLPCPLFQKTLSNLCLGQCSRSRHILRG